LLGLFDLQFCFLLLNFCCFFFGGLSFGSEFSLLFSGLFSLLLSKESLLFLLFLSSLLSGLFDLQILLGFSDISLELLNRHCTRVCCCFISRGACGDGSGSSNWSGLGQILFLHNRFRSSFLNCNHWLNDRLDNWLGNMSWCCLNNLAKFWLGLLNYRSGSSSYWYRGRWRSWDQGISSGDRNRSCLSLRCSSRCSWSALKLGHELLLLIISHVLSQILCHLGLCFWCWLLSDHLNGSGHQLSILQSNLFFLLLKGTGLKVGILLRMN